jgi:hypothetical protein
MSDEAATIRHRDDLLASGFKQFDGHSPVSSYDVLFQKRVCDEHGTRYFIDVMLWKFPDHDGWQWEVNYNDGCDFSNGVTMRIVGSPYRDDWDAAGVIAWADQLWVRLGPKFYEKNNE